MSKSAKTIAAGMAVATAVATKIRTVIATLFLIKGIPGEIE